MIISAPQLFINGRFEGPANLVIDNGRIAALLPGDHSQADIRLDHGLLTPGLIDLHNNGAFGVDFCSASPADWDRAIEKLAEHGVTSLLPTLITAPFEALQAAASRVAAAMANAIPASSACIWKGRSSRRKKPAPIARTGCRHSRMPPLPRC